MSHQLKSLQLDYSFNLGGCVLPSPLVPGAKYRFTGLTQGTLGAYEIEALALSTTELSRDVLVFPAVGDQWRGWFDFASCELWYLEDNIGNVVHDPANINVFPWHNPSVSRNRVEQTSTFIPGPNILQFKSSNIRGSSVVDFSGSTGNIDVSASTWDAGTVLTSTATNTQLFYTSHFSGSTINLAGDGPVEIEQTQLYGSTINKNNSGDLLIERVLIASNSLVDLNTVTRVTIRNSVIMTGSNVFLSTNLTGAALLTLTNVTLASGSGINAVAGATLNANASITSAHLVSSSQIRIQSTFSAASTIFFAALQDSGVLEWSGGNITDLNIERGQLFNAGFGVSRVRLENSNSTLVANAISATKSGYTNALP